MEGTNLILSGVYDKRTIEFALGQGITHFSFDFRPTSVNFIQQYILEDCIDVLMKDYNPKRFKIFLKFHHEKDFMIKNILSSFEGTGIEVTLQILSNEDTEYFKALGSKLSLYYDQDVPMQAAVKSGLVESVSLSYQYLEELAQSERLYHFISNMNARLGSHFPYVIALNWDLNVSRVVLDGFDIDYVELPINNFVEVCYRNVDLSKLDKGLKNYQTFL